MKWNAAYAVSAAFALALTAEATLENCEKNRQ